MDEKLDTLDERLDRHERRLQDVEGRAERMALALYGDEGERFIGLMERTALTEQSVNKIADWQHMMEVRWETVLTLIRVGLAVMGLTGVGVWLPVIKQIIAATGGQL